MQPGLALVTGGTKAIGAAIVRELRAAGYAVVASYVSDEAGARAFSEATGAHVRRWDVADYDACQARVQEIEQSLGPITVLCNNAGIRRHRPILEMSRDDWQKVIDTNLGSCFNMSKAVLPGMIRRRFGRIVNISSLNGQTGRSGQANYVASKAGIIGFTKTLALEGAPHNVTANTICPGYIESDAVAALTPDIADKLRNRIPLRRFGGASEIGAAVVYLASEQASFVTGATLSINGGQAML